MPCDFILAVVYDFRFLLLLLLLFFFRRTEERYENLGTSGLVSDQHAFEFFAQDILLFK